MDTNFKEIEVTVKGQCELKGTLTIPQTGRSKYHTVIIVAGSGEVDRNGNAVKMKLNSNIYKELAEFITGLGFITFRYDKRGVGASKGSYMDTGMWDLVDDIQSSICRLKEFPQVDGDNIILLGHSEGCTLITAAYSKSQPSGMIMLSGAGEPIIDALKRQRDIMFSEMLGAKGFKGSLFRLLKIDRKGEAQAQKVISKVKKSNTDTIKYNIVKINAKWQREHFQYDLFEDLKKVKCPVLAITGDKDFQANPERLNDLPSMVKGEAKCHVIKNMDHILKEYTGPVTAMNFRKQYMNEASHPLHKDLTRLIKDWIIANYTLKD